MIKIKHEPTTKIPTIQQLHIRIVGLFGKNWWLWTSIILGSIVVHFGTATLRLGSFLPFPQALDFSSYYAAAWSVRLNTSPYNWSEPLLAFLTETQNLAATPPLHNSPPLWPILLQPITILPYPAAATLWLFILLLIVMYAHFLLLSVAGYNSWKIFAVTLPFTLTFGPLFLNLTLGQNGVFLLLSVLLLGETVKNQNRSHLFCLLSLTLWVIAVGAKIYPALWILCLPFLKRWRTLAIAAAMFLLMFGAATLLKAEIAAEYWLDFLPGRTEQFSETVSINDQSLSGFLSRVGKPNQFSFSGLTVQERHEINWQLPWDFSTQSIQYLSVILFLLLGFWVISSWIRRENKDTNAILYAFALLSLLPFPHMARYNHILALPAMALLWNWGTPYRHLTIIAYGLFALSRLNHLWALLLPPPFGPIASGFGLFGVLVLIIGISYPRQKDDGIVEGSLSIHGS